MKPDWDKLMADYAGHASALVGEVDCTADGAPLCEAIQIPGYPGMKYGPPDALADYKGKRDYASMKAFAAEILKTPCSPNDWDACDPGEKEEIEKYNGESDEELNTKIAKSEEMLKAIQVLFDADVGKLNTGYNLLKKHMNDNDKNFNGFAQDVKDLEEAHAKAKHLGEMRAEAVSRDGFRARKVIQAARKSSGTVVTHSTPREPPPAAIEEGDFNTVEL